MNTLVIAAASAAAGAAAGYAARAADLGDSFMRALRDRGDRIVIRWGGKPGWRRTALRAVLVPAAWAVDVAHLIPHPRRSWRAWKAWGAVSADRLPAELRDAVAETVRLHLPYVNVARVTFQVFAKNDGTVSYDTANVAFVHRHGDLVTRVTLGGSYVGNPPGAAPELALKASRDRVKAALETLPTTPDVWRIRVPVDA